MRQGNILNEATAVSLATFLGEAIRLVIQIVARDHTQSSYHGNRSRPLWGVTL